MRHLSLLIAAAFFCQNLAAQKMLHSHEWCAEGRKAFTPPMADGRSDSLDITDTRIELDLMAAPKISATCWLSVQAKVPGVKSTRLDLEGLTVEEVIYDNLQPVPFQQSGPALNISHPTLHLGEVKTLRIKYSGTPKTDASGWGGVYNTSGYTFNLGVGFAADPHSFGRAWFPCFDNFVERSTLDVTVTAPAAKPAYGNGALVSETVQNGQSIRRWRIEQSIPAYLACFAAGPYTSWKRSMTGANGPIPVEIAAAASDTSKVRATFKNLQPAVQCYEHWFGPYRWNKIGYSLVPFNSGAMEHATNIAIMRSAIDGSLGFETLWAHELSHMWWGDLATCSTAEDMWLNEGWASYSEHLFTEWVYGRQKYVEAVRDNHLAILQNAHINEGGYLAVSGVPHSLTYGDHVYKKGATVAHNLRGYLGDSLFRAGCRAALAQTEFTDWSSTDFRDRLSAATGRDLTDFFENWVFAGGYPDYSIDSVKWIFSPVDAPTIARVSVKQKLRGAPKMHQNVPLEFTFVGYDGQRVHRTATVSGENSVVEFSFPAWGPTYRFVFVNTNLRLALARSEQERVVKTTGTHNFTLAKLNLTITAITDSAFVRVEHHFAMPDTAGAANPQGYKLTNRYWSVEGALPNGFQARATVFYDGRGKMDQLDTELFAQTSPNEDSVLLLYRPAPGYPWQEYPTYVKNKLTPNDRYGILSIDNFRTGQYTIGKGRSTVSANEPRTYMEVKISPNPADSAVQLSAPEPFEHVVLTNTEGRTVREWSFDRVTSATVDVKGLPTGTYWLLLRSKTHVGAAGLLLHSH